MDDTKQSNITKHREGIRGTVLCGLFAAIIAVLTLVTIPMPSGVPITLQTFAVALCGYSLGCAKGTAATFVYVALGAVGLPVFSGMKGGFSVLVGPTGGYIAGFLGAALVYWLMTARKNTTARKIAGMAVGMFVCYLFGTLWYVFATGVGLAGFIAATAKCVLPFIVPDAMKCVLAFWLAKKIRIKK